MKLFSEEEVNNLREGVKQFGVGKWSVILKHYKFNDRSSVDLKDKWRNLVKKDEREKEEKKILARQKNISELLKRSEPPRDSEHQQRFEGLPLKMKKVVAVPNSNPKASDNTNGSAFSNKGCVRANEDVNMDNNNDDDENSDIEHAGDDQPLTDDEYIDFSSGSFVINRSSESKINDNNDNNDDNNNGNGDSNDDNEVNDDNNNGNYDNEVNNDNDNYDNNNDDNDNDKYNNNNNNDDDDDDTEDDTDKDEDYDDGGDDCQPLTQMF